MAAQLSIIVVSYNTRSLTLDCLRSVYGQTRKAEFELLVVDNNSTDDSAEAIASEFPQARLFAHHENLGFAAANNLAAGHATGEWLLLLNPDTIVLEEAIDTLVAFAKQHPTYGIYGGRTFFHDGTLNPTSCWRRITLWSMFCHAVGLSHLFPRSRVFNPESMGRWQRDTVREVDIVTGCFLLIRRSLWEQLGGFAPAFFMYGEEADLCLRARQVGARPVICPAARIIHYGGRSELRRTDKLVRLLAARRRLICRHWHPLLVPLGEALQDVSILARLLFRQASMLVVKQAKQEEERGLLEIWSRREEWRSLPPSLCRVEP